MQIQRMCTNYYVADYEVWVNNLLDTYYILTGFPEPYIP
jgi:hypothetical protein